MFTQAQICYQTVREFSIPRVPEVAFKIRFELASWTLYAFRLTKTPPRCPSPTEKYMCDDAVKPRKEEGRHNYD